MNTILYELRLLIWDRTGDYVLDKHRIIPAAGEFDSGATLASETLEAIQCYLVGDEPLSREQVERELQVVSEYVRNQVQWSVPPFAPALIRPLIEHDIEQFLAWRAGDDYVRDVARREIQEHLEGRRVLLVAEAGEQLVGTVQFVPAHVDSDLADGRTTAYLQALEVREDFRRQGLGTHLVSASRSSRTQANCGGEDLLPSCACEKRWHLLPGVRAPSHRWRMGFRDPT